MFDSDAMLITDNQVLIRCAMKYYYTFKVPTMVMDSQKKKRKYTNADKADLDIYCNSDRIGITVNLSQELNTIMWDKINRSGDWNTAMKAYYDNCLLSILSMIEIDSAKKEYPLDCMEELQVVRERYNDRDEDGKSTRPNFFAHVAKKKGYYDPQKKNYKKHLAPMDFVQEVVNKHKKRTHYFAVGSGLQHTPIGELFEKAKYNQKARYGYVDLVLSMVRDMNNKTRMIYQSGDSVASGSEKRKLASKYFERCVEGIKTMHLNDATMYELMLAMDNPKNADIKRKLWTILFGALGNELSSLLMAAKEPIYTIEECPSGEDGDTDVFWLQFRHVRSA